MLLFLCQGNPLTTSCVPHTGPVTRSLMFDEFIVWTICWRSSRLTNDLRRQCDAAVTEFPNNYTFHIIGWPGTDVSPHILFVKNCFVNQSISVCPCWPLGLPIVQVSLFSAQRPAFGRQESIKWIMLEWWSLLDCRSKPCLYPVEILQ